MTDVDANNRMQKRIIKVLDTRYESNKETLEALENLSSFINENNLQTRRNLRSKVEKQSLTINYDFLNTFHDVKTVIGQIVNEIKSMSVLVYNMQERLKGAGETTYELIVKSNQLQLENKKLTSNRKIAHEFLNQYQLKSEENKELFSKNSQITNDFFKILNRVGEVHSNCSVLMQSGYQTLALDILEEMNSHQETALEKLYRWVQNHCRNSDSLELVNPLINQTMQKLQYRPVLFKYVVDEYATTRRSILVRSFIDALTSSGSNSIEMYVDDIKRYVGDIFAWIHQALLSEKENLLLLVKQCDQLDVTDIIQSAFTIISDTVVQPLKMRIQATLNGKNTILLYEVANLIRFYQNIINHVVKGGQLELCLEELRQMGEAAYINSIMYQVKIQLQNPQISETTKNLLPPANIEQLLILLKEILSVASLVEERESDINKIVNCIVDPILVYVTESASTLSIIDMAVYILNCLYEIQATISIFEYMEIKLERVQAQCDAQCDTLTSEQASSLVSNLSLGQIYTILQNNTKLDVELLKLFLNKFYQFIEDPNVLLLPQLNMLISSSHRSIVQKRSYEVLTAIYKQIYERLEETENNSLFYKTPDQVFQLLNL